MMWYGTFVFFFHNPIKKISVSKKIAKENNYYNKVLKKGLTVFNKLHTQNDVLSK